MKKTTKKISLLIFIFIILTIFYFFENKTSNLQVCFIDVGQGDSILIKSPSGKNILIDGGPTADLIQKLGLKLAYRNNKIDLLVITHAHTDHYIGLIEIIKRYNIKLILWSGIDAHNSSYLYFKKLTENLNPKIALLGQEYLIEPNLKIKILYPIHQINNEKAKDLNNTSVSLILSHKNIDFFLAGDLTCEGEEEIIKQNLNIQVEIYKVSHHGSRWSNCDDILNQLKPEIAIIQSGIYNKHKHPHTETLERLKERNIKILRNDKIGDIWITSNGEKYWIKSSLSSSFNSILVK